jgi:1-deoxy-D-xylulose-5-phosphate reductoisomerase
LFQLPQAQIDIVVHPQSVVHGLVCYSDGSVLAQLGSPDMRTPIAYTLAWPERMPAPVKRLDLAQLGKLTFEPPDPERFPSLRLARAALRQGGGAPTILNAANEAAVHAFLNREIGFRDIARVVERTLEILPDRALSGLDDVYALDREARRVAARFFGSRPNAVAV